MVTHQGGRMMDDSTRGLTRPGAQRGKPLEQTTSANGRRQTFDQVRASVEVTLSGRKSGFDPASMASTACFAAASFSGSRERITTLVLAALFSSMNG